MKKAYTTDAGTDVYEPTIEEYMDWLETQAKALTGLTVAEFKSSYAAGECDDADPAVAELAMLLRTSQDF